MSTSNPGAEDNSSDKSPPPKGFQLKESVANSSENSDQNLEDGREPKISGDATFEATEDFAHYKPMPQYEGLHRWDPYFRWEPAEEKALVRRVCMVVYFEPMIGISMIVSS